MKKNLNKGSEKLDHSSIKYLTSILFEFNNIEQKGKDYWDAHPDNVTCQWLNKGYRLDLEGMRERMLKGGWAMD